MKKQKPWHDLIRTEDAEGKRVLRAPEGYQFLRGRGQMLVRGQSRTERIEDLLARECERLGWRTDKIRVKEYRKLHLSAKDGGIFFVNVGPFRGLEPNAMFCVLAALPSQCGRKKIFAALEKLEERVEIA